MDLSIQIFAIGAKWNFQCSKIQRVGKRSSVMAARSPRKPKSNRTESISHMTGNKIERIGMNIRKTYPAVGRAIKVIGDRIEHLND